MKTVIDQINKIYDKFNKLNEWFIIFLMSAMCLDLLGQVIMRYVFQHPLTWSEELARYIFVWIALLGSAWCGRNHIHVRMTAVTSLLPKPAVHVIQILISIICAFFRQLTAFLPCSFPVHLSTFGKAGGFPRCFAG